MKQQNMTVVLIVLSFANVFGLVCESEIYLFDQTCSWRIIELVRCKGLFRISRKQGGPFAGVGGYLFLTRFPRGGGTKILRRLRGGGTSIFVHTQKRNN